MLGAVAAMLYKYFFDPAHLQVVSSWSTWEPELLVMYGAAGFAVGWVVGFAFSRLGDHD
jgi:hypothetical protein